MTDPSVSITRCTRPGAHVGDLTGRAESRVNACGPGRQASSPLRPATPGDGAGAHEVTARDPSPPAGPGASRAAPPRSRPAGPFFFPSFRGTAAPGRRLPSPTGRGPDLTRRAERSVRRPGPTDGPPPGTVTAPSRPPPPGPQTPEPPATRC